MSYDTRFVEPILNECSSDSIGTANNEFIEGLLTGFQTLIDIAIILSFMIGVVYYFFMWVEDRASNNFDANSNDYKNAASIPGVGKMRSSFGNRQTLLVTAVTLPILYTILVLVINLTMVQFFSTSEEVNIQQGDFLYECLLPFPLRED